MDLKAFGKHLIALCLILTAGLVLPACAPSDAAAQAGTERRTAETRADGGAADLQAADRVTVHVERVVDGDTVIVNHTDGRRERIRLTGIDTPESVHQDVARNSEYGAVASDYTKARLADRDVQLEFDVEPSDRYGRGLAYVWVDGILFNEELIRLGYAKALPRQANQKYMADFLAAQREAKRSGAGFWAEGSYYSR